jgi:hypothetical protein
VDEAERLHVLEVAARLGVEAPLEDGRLRRVGGACVFLLEDHRCRIHAELGAEHKPVVCRQYPIVAVQTEAGVRVGVDPGCYRHVASWKDGPPLPAGSVRAGRLLWAPDQAAVEEAALAALRGGRLIDALASLVGTAPGQLPPGFAREAVSRLAGLEAVLADESFGGSLRAALGPVAAALPEWRVRLPEGDVFPDEAYAIDAVERALRLRLLHHLGSPFAAAWLMTAGAVITGWATSTPDAHGAALAAWTRGLRAGPFLRMMLGEGDGLRAFVMGSAVA